MTIPLCTLVVCVVNQEDTLELQDEIFIEAPREVVFAALNDPDVLKECIPGCQELTKEGENELAAKVALKIGPVKATFGGNVTLDPSEAPSNFSLMGEGNGGVAGFAKGGADVELIEQDGGTLLKYTAKADIGGKLAQLGNRLVVSTSKKLSKQFFEKFNEVLTGGDEESVEGEEADDSEKKGFWKKLVS